MTFKKIFQVSLNKSHDHMVGFLSVSRSSFLSFLPPPSSSTHGWLIPENQQTTKTAVATTTAAGTRDASARLESLVCFFFHFFFHLLTNAVQAPSTNPDHNADTNANDTEERGREQ
jgi:hypothetical protein